MDPIPLKTPPAYAIASIDHALRLATILQLEGALTVTAAAERLGVAPSTAHRVLQMLVYRDFARQDEARVYRPGLLLELAAHSPDRAAELRRVAMPYLHRLSATFEESVNVSIRVGDTTRFIASSESNRPGRVSSREGMVFPLHLTTTGMLYLASQPRQEFEQHLDRHFAGRVVQRRSLQQDVDRARQFGFAVNRNRSENGLVAVGVALPRLGGEFFAGLSVVLPSTRFDEARAQWNVSVLRAASIEIAQALAGWTREIELAG